MITTQSIYLSEIMNYRLLLSLLASVWMVASSFAGENAFETLFDGKSLDGWQHGGNWFVTKDGALSRKEKGGSIRYVKAKVPDDFELRFEWKVAARSNSGVYYRPSQYEYQILDNGEHPDGQNPRTSAASLYFCMPPCCDMTNPVGEWNTARIVAKGSVIQHWLNGKMVVGFDYKDPKWAQEVALLKARGGDLEARGANLSFQDHGDPVWYRNIQWREIPEDEVIDGDSVTPATIPAEILEKEKKKLEGILKSRARQEAAKKEKSGKP